MARLTNKVCLITGTGGSMGKAAALQFAREGAKIVGCDVSVERAAGTVASVEAIGGEIISLHPCDLTDLASVDALVALAVERFGGIDVLFNNAAMAYFGPVAQLSIEDWHKTINEEVHLVYYLVRAAWPELVKSSGAIINTASISAHQAYRPLPAVSHAAAKGAILSLTRQLAMEGAPHGIRANSISPGLIATHQTVGVLGDAEISRVMTDQIMLGRAGTADEIASVALFLASEESSYITGADIKVDGGLSAW